MSYTRKWLPKKEPHLPPDYDDMVILAVRAFAAGKANDGQQKLVWDYMMYVTTASEAFQDMSYRPGPTGDRATIFAEGKRFAGLMLRKLLHPALTPIDKVQPTAGRSEQIIDKRAERLDRIRDKRKR